MFLLDVPYYVHVLINQSCIHIFTATNLHYRQLFFSILLPYWSHFCSLYSFLLAIFFIPLWSSRYYTKHNPLMPHCQPFSWLQCNPKLLWSCRSTCRLTDDMAWWLISIWQYCQRGLHLKHVLFGHIVLIIVAWIAELMINLQNIARHVLGILIEVLEDSGHGCLGGRFCQGQIMRFWLESSTGNRFLKTCMPSLIYSTNIIYFYCYSNWNSNYYYNVWNWMKVMMDYYAGIICLTHIASLEKSSL